MAILTRNPTSDISATGTWSGTAGSRWQLVDDYPSTDTGDQLTHGTTAGQILFGYDAISLPSVATITSVKIKYYDREASNGPNNVGAALRIGGVDYSATTHNPGTTTTLRTDTFTTNPRTGVAWTADDINGAGSNGLTGFGLVSTDANPAVSITSIQMEVDYAVDYPITADTGHYGVSGKGVSALDAYPGAAAAFSLRKLRNDYSGNCIRVQRSSDNTQQDIGFGADGFIDESALTSFVGSGDGFVVTWYDQSTNGYNAIGLTNFPRIVNAGTIDRSNGKVAIFHNGSLIFSTAPGLALSSGDSSHLNIFRNVEYAHMFAVARSTIATSAQRAIFNANITGSTTSARSRIGHATGAAEVVAGRRLDADGFVSVGPSGTPSTTQYVWSGLLNYVDASAGLWLNGASVASSTSFQTAGNTSNTASQSITIGRQAVSGSPWVGYIQEVIVYNTDQRQNRAALETSLNADWEVYSDASTATLSYDKTMTAEAGTFTLTGEDVTLTVETVGGSFTITAEVGTFTLTGEDAGVLYGRLLNAEVNAFTLIGNTVVLDLTIPSVVVTVTGEFLFTGNDSTLTYSADAPDFSADGLNALPTDNAILSYVYSAGDVTNVATLDDVTVDIRGRFAIHQYQVDAAMATSAQFQWKGFSTHPTSISTLYLQAWDDATAEWVTLATDSTTAAGDLITVLGAMGTNIIDYKDENAWITIRVWQEGRA
jgi:hypothetical protein